MPYKRKRTKTYRKRNFKKAIQAVINSNLETKQRDIELNSVAIPDQALGGITYELPYLTQGDGQNGRTGNLINVTGIYSMFHFRAADTTNAIRIILYIPKCPTDEVAVDYYELIDQDKYTVLYDRLISLSTQGPTSKTVSLRRSFKRGGKKGIAVHYSSGTANAYTKNAIKLYFVSDSGAVTHPDVSGFLRMYFKDA